MTEECFFDCPFCMETISVVVDCTVADQTYIEDCEVCCRPISLRVHVLDGLSPVVDPMRS